MTVVQPTPLYMSGRTHGEAACSPVELVLLVMLLLHRPVVAAFALMPRALPWLVHSRLKIGQLSLSLSASVRASCCGHGS